MGNTTERRVMKMKKNVINILAVSLTAVMLLAGCSRSRSHALRDEELQMAVETTAEVRSYNSADTAYVEGFYAEGAAAADYEADYAYTEAPAEEYYSGSSSAGAGNGSIQATEADLTERMLIRNVSMACETLHFNELTSDIEDQISSLGGYIESKTFSGTGNAGDLRRASYSIRVSSEGLDALVRSIGTAAIITNTSENTEDVTLTYADTQARIESLRVEQETLNSLLADADSLDIVLQLQNELTNVRYQIESYESQLRVLENLSSYSTLNLNITEVLEETEPEEPRIKTYGEKFGEAFRDGIDRAKESLQDLGIWFAENVIGIAVIIVLTVAAVIIIKVIIKKMRKKKAAKAVKSEPSAPAPDKKD